MYAIMLPNCTVVVSIVLPVAQIYTQMALIYVKFVSEDQIQSLMRAYVALDSSETLAQR